MIYHIVSNINWQKTAEAAGNTLQGFYEPESLLTEGFIHSSKSHQVKGVLERYYKGQKDLLLLHIDETKLTAPLKFEKSPSINEEFPHIYGPLNIDAVIKVESL